MLGFIIYSSQYSCNYIPTYKLMLENITSDPHAEVVLVFSDVIKNPSQIQLRTGIL